MYIIPLTRVRLVMQNDWIERTLDPTQSETSIKTVLACTSHDPASSSALLVDGLARCDSLDLLTWMVGANHAYSSAIPLEAALIIPFFCSFAPTSPVPGQDSANPASLRLTSSGYLDGHVARGPRRD
jgi:hypothetical protein